MHLAMPARIQVVSVPSILGSIGVLEWPAFLYPCRPTGSLREDDYTAEGSSSYI